MKLERPDTVLLGALTALYQRLRQAGKPPKLAFVAVARKLLTILNAIARERTAWQA